MPALTIASSLVCPHGGKVQIISGNTRVRVAGAPMASSADRFVITGCCFTLPGPTPSPCLTVEWVSVDKLAKLAGGHTLGDSSVGLCKAGSGAIQGRVAVAATQPRASCR
jgi:hypothetical protein